MDISYSDTKDFTREQLRDLFLSVHWSSGEYPDKLQAAMRNSDRVISAWDGDILAGLVNALSDGIMTAYFHYLLVHPQYQSLGIGKHLLLSILDHYADYPRKIVIAYDSEIPFYENCGFTLGESKSPMFITSLTT